MLSYSEDYELSRTGRSDTYVTYQSSVHDIVSGHGRSTDLYEIALRGGSACEHSVSEQSVRKLAIVW